MLKRFILIFLFNLTILSTYGQVRDINADMDKTEGQRSETYRECIGAGRAAEGLRADWQQQLTIIQKEIGFKYIRFHGLLHDDMHVYTEDAAGNPIYNWQYIDQLYDFLLSIHIRPFVELSFMPPAMASNEQTVFWWKGNISPPKSYEKWSLLITALVKHFEERYGKAEVEKWYFEVWNEPNLKQFFSGDINEYFKLYDVAAKAIKNVSATYRVGGPATSGSTWIKEALQHFSANPQLTDFISTHAYGTKSVFDEYGKRRTQMREADGIPIAINKLKNDVEASPLSNREIHITEWNSSPNPHDPLHDTYQNASYILNTLKKTEKLVNSMSYWTFTDIFEEAGPPVTPFHGGFGLLTLQGIKKPSFWAYRFLNQLSNIEVSNRDASSIICKNARGSFQTLVWNYTLLSPDSSYNQQFYGHVIPPKSANLVKLNFKNLHNGKYKLRIYKIGYHFNDPYTAYLEMGSPSQITLSQEKQLKELSSGKPIMVDIVSITNHNWAKDFNVDQNDVFLIKMERL